MKALDISLTNYCPNRCSYCSMNSYGKSWRQDSKATAKFIDPIKLQDYIAEFKPDLILLSGGEPTEHPDFEMIYEMCKAIAKTVALQTYDNGHKLIVDGKVWSISIGGKFHFGENTITLPDKNKQLLLDFDDYVNEKFLGMLDYKVLSPHFDTLGVGRCWSMVHSEEVPQCYCACAQIKIVEELCRYLKIGE